MATEILNISINDTELDQVIAKLEASKLGGVEAPATTTRLNDLNKLIRDTRQEARATGLNLDTLPTVNRDMRLLLGSLRIPGMRETLQGLFQARRGLRAAQYMREAEALTAKGLAPELAKELSISSLVGYAALILFVVKIIHSIVQGEIARIERRRGEFEDFMRRDAELTHREFRELQAEQIGFATWRDQFQEEWDREGFLAALVDLAVDRMRSLWPDLPPAGLPKSQGMPYVNPGE